MLDSLGSTLSRETIDSFFTRFGKKPHEDVLTMDESVLCLETELCRPSSEKKRINFDENVLPDTSVPATPSYLASYDLNLPEINLDKLDFAGPVGNQPSSDSVDARKPGPPSSYHTDPMEQPLSELAVLASPAHGGTTPTPRATHFDRQPSGTGSGASSDAEDGSPPSGSGSGSSSPGSSDDSPSSSSSFERVINVKNCPLCHRPRMTSKAEVDIVTHLAVCASQDWARVDRIVVGNFVTASQAQIGRAHV